MGKGSKSKYARIAETRGGRRELKDEKKARAQMRAKDAAVAVLGEKRATKARDGAGTTIKLSKEREELVLKLIGLLAAEGGREGDVDVEAAMSRLGLHGDVDEDGDGDREESEEDGSEDDDVDNEGEDEDDDESEENEDSGEEEEEEGGNTAELAAQLLAQQRHETEQTQQAHLTKTAAMKAAAKAATTALAKTTGKHSKKRAGASSCADAPPPSPDLRASLRAAPPASPTVRIQLCCSKGKGGQVPKPFVLERAVGVYGPGGLVELARKKCNASGKKYVIIVTPTLTDPNNPSSNKNSNPLWSRYCELMLLPDKLPLDEMGLYHLVDDSIVLLCTVQDLPRPEGGRVSNAAKANAKEGSSIPAPTDAEAEESDEGRDEGEKEAASASAMPVRSRVVPVSMLSGGRYDIHHLTLLR
jgi:hypothetical protein